MFVLYNNYITDREEYNLAKNSIMWKVNYKMLFGEFLCPSQGL